VFQKDCVARRPRLAAHGNWLGAVGTCCSCQRLAIAKIGGCDAVTRRLLARDTMTETLQHANSDVEQAVRPRANICLAHELWEPTGAFRGWSPREVRHAWRNLRAPKAADCARPHVFDLMQCRPRLWPRSVGP